MDFDSIVTFLFIIAFFILPSIFKKVMARKKKPVTPKKVKMKLSIFDRIREQIQQFVKELEEQAKQQKKETRDNKTVWETLGEDEESPPVVESVGDNADLTDPGPKVFPPRAKKRIQHRKRIQKPCTDEQVLQRSMYESCRFKSNPLQNAIIWSEILSKPLALRDK